MKKKLFILAAVMTALSLTMSGCGCKKTADDKNTDNTAAVGMEVDKEYTPTFMYFVSPNDSDYEAAMAVVAKLQEEYKDKVNFDIHNVEETPEDKENFPVDGATPALIMLNTKNEPSAFEFKCSDEATLKKDIEAAMQ